ncbi:MAG: type III secretion system inner membrane ring subunit SctD [Deltaproteobacteria bacterium]|jgi:type III secretion protein D|nr:type III secretion system inner membrane ring subunit SctD [Deltaproteobacteria bacterium]
MSRESVIAELRVLCGPNLGAAVQLGPGQYVFGSDDSCDFVLADASVAPRHLAITVSGEDGAIRVTAQSLEAAVVFEGGQLPDAGTMVSPGTPLGLGFTALAWREAGESWAPITLVPMEYHNPPQPGAPSETVAEAKSQEGQGEEMAATDEAGTEDVLGQAVAIPLAVERKRRSPIFWVGLAALVLVLAPMFYSQYRWGGDEAARAGRVQALLDEGGFQGLTVEPGSDAAVISGSLANDLELARLIDLVRGQPLKVYLRLTVINDRIKAVKDAMNSHGFYPEVKLTDTGMSVAAYMKDSLVEAKAFGYVDLDVRDAVISRRHIVHQRQLDEALKDETQRAGLPEMPVTFADGHLEFPVTLDIEARQSLDEAVSTAGRRLGVPIFYQISLPGGDTQIMTEALLANPPETTAGLSAQEEEDGDEGQPLAGLRVTGVTMSPLRFVSADGGQKLFEGSVLKSGYTIVEIRNGEIVLSRDGREIIHKLGD